MPFRVYDVSFREGQRLPKRHDGDYSGYLIERRLRAGTLRELTSGIFLDYAWLTGRRKVPTLLWTDEPITELRMAMKGKPLSLGLRLAGIVLLVGLFCAWVGLSQVMVSLGLDYPIRCAGLLPGYPARGSVAFYRGCVEGVLHSFIATIYFWAGPALLAFWLSAKVFPALRGFRYWLTGLACLVLPVIGWCCYEFYISADWERPVVSEAQAAP
ncbi:MAG: hypothetical protein JWO89_2401 [Verrucomicrobiaceae bacterium]|nr:hypothetical protein [Verrucomicrobiaceae bacterium]